MNVLVPPVILVPRAKYSTVTNIGLKRQISPLHPPRASEKERGKADLEGSVL